MENLTSLESLAEFADKNYLQMIKDKQITSILRAIGLFPDQTITNDVLILSQKPDSICVKRMKEWNYYKRTVKKNEKALKVISHYIDKIDRGPTDQNGNVYTKGTEKLDTVVGYVFDISQTEGKQYEYLNSNKENIAKHFEVAKKALENTIKSYKVIYQDQDEMSKIDTANKTISIKDGLTLDEVLTTLIRSVTQVLLSSKKEDGIRLEQEPLINDIELNSAIYAIHSKLGLDLPEFDFDKISTFKDENIMLLKDNLQKVRSVTKQVLSNFEIAIESAVRGIDNELDETESENGQEITDKTKIKAKTKQEEIGG
jgi:hypothetical protein